MGPEGGNAGGQIVATGTPEEVADVNESHTGYFLKGRLSKGPSSKPARRKNVVCGTAGI
jgi:excinuclease ABC subunit A